MFFFCRPCFYTVDRHASNARLRSLSSSLSVPLSSPTTTRFSPEAARFLFPRLAAPSPVHPRRHPSSTKSFPATHPERTTPHTGHRGTPLSTVPHRTSTQCTHRSTWPHGTSITASRSCMHTQHPTIPRTQEDADPFILKTPARVLSHHRHVRWWLQGTARATTTIIIIIINAEGLSTSSPTGPRPRGGRTSPSSPP